MHGSGNAVPVSAFSMLEISINEILVIAIGEMVTRKVREPPRAPGAVDLPPRWIDHAMDIISWRDRIHHEKTHLGPLTPAHRHKGGKFEVFEGM